MPRLTVLAGIILIALGVGAWLAFARSSMTALIPAFFGLPLLLLGLLAFRPDWRRHAMHAAVAVALLGFAGSVPGLGRGVAALLGQAPQRPAAVASQSAMALVTGALVVLGVRSFVLARRQREEAPAAARSKR